MDLPTIIAPAAAAAVGVSRRQLPDRIMQFFCPRLGFLINMGQMPLYQIREDIFPELELSLIREGLNLTCTSPMQLQPGGNGETMYRGWEVRRGKVREIVMWDTIASIDAMMMSPSN